MAMQDLLGDFYTTASRTGVALRELGGILDKHKMGSLVCCALGKTHDLVVGTSWPQQVGKGALALGYNLIDPD